MRLLCTKNCQHFTLLQTACAGVLRGKQPNPSVVKIDLLNNVGEGDCFYCNKFGGKAVNPFSNKTRFICLNVDSV